MYGGLHAGAQETREVCFGYFGWCLFMDLNLVVFEQSISAVQVRRNDGLAGKS